MHHCRFTPNLSSQLAKLETIGFSPILNNETNGHGSSHLFVVKAASCVKKMKYDRKSIADVY